MNAAWPVRTVGLVVESAADEGAAGSVAAEIAESGSEDGKAEDGRSGEETVRMIHETSQRNELREVRIEPEKLNDHSYRCGGGVVGFEERQ